jgi:hypothetical protein
LPLAIIEVFAQTLLAVGPIQTEIFRIGVLGRPGSKTEHDSAAQGFGVFAVKPLREDMHHTISFRHIQLLLGSFTIASSRNHRNTYAAWRARRARSIRSLVKTGLIFALAMSNETGS